MTTTAPRPTAVGTLRERVISFAGRLTTPLVPADYLDVIDPLRSGVAARSHRRDRARNPRCGHRGDQAGARLAVAYARPVRPDRHRRRRRPPVAGLLADLGYRPPRRVHLHHGQGHSRRRREQPPRSARHRRHRHPTRSGCRRLHPRRADAGQDPVPHRRQRHHPGDGDAAQPAVRRTRTSWSCTRRRPPAT